MFIGIAALLSLCVLYFVFARSRAFVYEEHLDDIVLSVDDKEITLREFGYYIYLLETDVNKQAIVYDFKNPLDYWNKYFQAGMKSQFITRMAKNKAYDVCICDLIYEEMATQAGYELTQEDTKRALAAADEIYAGMSEQQILTTGLSREIIEEIQCRKYLIAGFAKDYVKTIDFEGYSGYREELISSGGAYYEKNILPGHKVEINNLIKEALRFGHITVNQKQAGNMSNS